MHKDKARDIARGVLPSTARKSARDDKREYKAKHRAEQRRVNGAICRSMNSVDDDGHIYTDTELFDDFEDTLVYDGYHSSTKKPNISWDDMKEIVYNRRSHDKLGPLIRWAQATHSRLMSGPEWTTSDKIAYFKAILPDSLQGRHALGHVKIALDLDEDIYLYGGRFRRRYVPTTKNDIRKGLEKVLATPKSRMAFHDFLLETVPVAAHTGEANNKIETEVQRRNEEGKLLFINHFGEATTNPRTKDFRSRPPIPWMTKVLIPQSVAVTCDACSFLRNSPLATAQDLDQFIDIIWKGATRSKFNRRSDSTFIAEHEFIRDIQNHLVNPNNGVC